MGSPTRQDGRVEVGQKISTAFSARAWNRAQEAADIVLGDKTRFGAGGTNVEPTRIVVPCFVTSTVTGVAPGHVVQLTAATGYVVPDHSNQNDTRAAVGGGLSGSVWTPVSLDNYADAKVQLGVIVGGRDMPSPGQPQYVKVCIAGMCIARVRARTVGGGNPGPYKFIQGSVLRSGDTATPLTGAAEASTCGHQRIVQYVGTANDACSYAVVIL